jgi:hypothetical protein
LVDVNIRPFAIELITRRGYEMRADVYPGCQHDAAHPARLLLPERPR